MNTKIRLKIGLRSALKNKEFTKITINDICKAAMLSRPTFYHYYRDKYQLANSIFDDLFDKTVTTLATSHKWQGSIDVFLTQFKQDCTFYSKIYKYTGQDSLFEHHSQRVYDFYKQLIEHTKHDKLSSEEKVNLDVYVKGAMTLIMDWNNESYSTDVKTMVKRFQVTIPNVLRKYISN